MGEGTERQIGVRGGEGVEIGMLVDEVGQRLKRYKEDENYRNSSSVVILLKCHWSSFIVSRQK